MSEQFLLAVDSGLRTGLALYNRNGSLLWYRSQNYGTVQRLKRAVHSMLQNNPELSRIILEGGGSLASIWAREAHRRNLFFQQISAQDWRNIFLLPRQQNKSNLAKQSATTLARKVILWSRAPNPTSLRHDAAEAILIGLWGVLDAGWLAALPEELKRKGNP